MSPLLPTAFAFFSFSSVRPPAVMLAAAVLGLTIIASPRSLGAPEVPVKLDPAPAAAKPGDTASITTDPVLKDLVRLKHKLAAGQRTEFPAGTAARNGSYFLALTETMTWEVAERFAEAHGAHLAVLPTEQDQNWFRLQFPFKRALWVGAGKSALDRWQWVDGSAWTMKGGFPGELSRHRHLALATGTGLLTASPTQTYGLALQWRRDGTNPASHESQLARIAASATLSDLNRIPYPVGARTLEDSHYFYFAKSMSWDDARKFAKSVGANLAVPSSTKEHRWICTTYADYLQDHEAIWLGGFRLKPNDRWQWLSREPWNNLGWNLDDTKEDPTLNRLALLKTSAKSLDWTASDGSSGQANGLLLEWSPPQSQVAAITEIEWKPWLKEANQTLAAQVEAELIPYRKERQRLIERYVRAMKQAGRGEGDRRVYREIERDLNNAEKAGQLLPSLPAAASEGLRNTQEEFQTGLGLIEGTYRQNLKGHFKFYVTGVQKRSDDLAANGYLALALKLKELVKPMQDDTLIARLFADTPGTSLPWAIKLNRSRWDRSN